MRSLKYLFIVVFLLTTYRISASVTWVVPDDQKSITAPEKFTPDMQKAGEQVYIKNCQSCHGMPGKDNWVRMTPPPGDLAKDQAQKNTDGELFYKITSGKAPMPEFRNIIPENDRWHIVAYIRSFNPGYVQPEPAALADFTGRIVSLAISYNESIKKLVITATEKLKDGSIVPAPGVEVILYAKRYFGNMPVGDPKITPANGQAIIDFPADLPGNKDGMVDLIAKVNDPRGQMKTTPAAGSFAIGTPTDKPGITETRAWWTTRDKAPIWIVAVYTGSVFIVWGFIFYILFLIMKIRKIS